MGHVPTENKTNSLIELWGHFKKKTHMKQN